MRRLAILTFCWLAAITPAVADAEVGVIEGTVTPISAAPEIEVCIGERQPSEACNAPDAKGSYSLAAREGRVLVEFVPSYGSRLLKQYYDHAASEDVASTVLVLPRQITKGINGDLVEGGAIKGVVTAAEGGGPLTEVEVCTISTGPLHTKHCVATDANGGYEVHSLPTGSYTVTFRGDGSSDEYEAGYFQTGLPIPGGTPVEVTAGITVTGIDGSLVKGAQIRGVVLSVGSPVSGIAACLFDMANPAPQRCQASEETGAFAFVGLAPGAYEVGFSLISAEQGGAAAGTEDGFESQFFDRAPDRAQAARISVSAGQRVEGVNGILLASPALIPSTSGPAAPPTVAAPPGTSVAADAAVRKCKRPKRKLRIDGKVRCKKPKQSKRTRQKHRKSGKHRHRNAPLRA